MGPAPGPPHPCWCAPPSPPSPPPASTPAGPASSAQVPSSGPAFDCGAVEWGGPVRRSCRGMRPPNGPSSVYCQTARLNRRQGYVYINIYVHTLYTIYHHRRRRCCCCYCSYYYYYIIIIMHVVMSREGGFCSVRVWIPFFWRGWCCLSAFRFKAGFSTQMRRCLWLSVSFFLHIAACLKQLTAYKTQRAEVVTAIKSIPLPFRHSQPIICNELNPQGMTVLAKLDFECRGQCLFHSFAMHWAMHVWPFC